MTPTSEGIAVHGILQDFEAASLRLRERGLSQHTADRIGLFLALTTAAQPARMTIADAWAYVDRFFPLCLPTATGAAQNSRSTNNTKGHDT